MITATPVSTQRRRAWASAGHIPSGRAQRFGDVQARDVPVPIAVVTDVVAHHRGQQVQPGRVRAAAGTVVGKVRRGRRGVKHWKAGAPARDGRRVETVRATSPPPSRSRQSSSTVTGKTSSTPAVPVDPLSGSMAGCREVRCAIGHTPISCLTTISCTEEYLPLPAAWLETATAR